MRPHPETPERRIAVACRLLLDEHRDLIPLGLIQEQCGGPPLEVREIREILTRAEVTFYHGPSWSPDMVWATRPLLRFIAEHGWFEDEGVAA